MSDYSRSVIEPDVLSWWRDGEVIDYSRSVIEPEALCWRREGEVIDYSRSVIEPDALCWQREGEVCDYSRSVIEPDMCWGREKCLTTQALLLSQTHCAVGWRAVCDYSRSVIEPDALCWGVGRGLADVVLHHSLNGPLAFLHQLQRPHFLDLHRRHLRQQLPATQQHVAQLPLHWQANVAGLRKQNTDLHLRACCSQC